jgi:hypothetical protein
MQPKQELADRVAGAAERALAHHQYVSAVDVLLGIGWTDGGSVQRWRKGQIDCLEAVLQTRPARIAEAMRLLRAWAQAHDLAPSEVPYLAATPRRETLRFSRSGEAETERLYRTHWVSTALSTKARQRLDEKALRAPELVVIQPLNDSWSCHRCGGTGALLMMETPGPACLRCVGLGELEFLPAGNTLLTRRAKAASAQHAVVVRFSKTRGRYERQGLLVEPAALAQAQREIEHSKGGQRR